MPQAVAAVVTFVSSLTWVDVALFAARVVGTAVISRLLAPKPPKIEFGSFARERKQVIRSSVSPRTVVYGEARVAGPMVFAGSSGTNGEYLHVVIPVAGHEVEQIGDVYLNDTLSTDARFTGVVRVTKHLGATDQVADSDLVSEVTDWSSDHRLQGVAYLYVRYKWDSTAYPTGMPAASAVVKGRQVYDPRTGSSAWSDNPALVILDYLRDTDYGLGASDDEIDLASFVAAANVCDEAVSLKAGGTVSRYTCNGVIDRSQRPDDIVEQLLSSCDGRLSYAQGTYRLAVGAWDEPSWSLDENDLRGTILVRPHSARGALYNTLRGLYVDPNQRWEPVDFPPQTDAAYVIEDGETIERDLQLSYTTHPATAQRIAHQTLERSRRALTVEMPCKLTALPVRVWDVVRVTNSLMGWNDKTFRVLQWTLAEEGGVDLLLQEEDASVYDWDPDTDETTIAAGAEPTIPDLSAVAAPTSLSVTSDPLVTAEGVNVARLAVTWTASADAFVIGYELQYKENSAGSYTVGALLGTVTEASIPFLQTGTAYDVRIRAINTRGAKSAWVEDTNTVAAGDTTAPSAASGLSATGGTGKIDLAWTNPTAADFTVSHVYRNTINDSGTATKIADVYGLPGEASAYSNTGLGAGATRYYWIKSVDASANASAFSTGASATST